MMPSGLYNVRDFGAAGDGRGKDTAALQAAIDACAAAGGGTVLVPCGTYRTGTVYLRSHTDFHLQAGARLLGSPDRADYNPDDVFPENEVFTRERVTGAHLLIAHRCENVSISGCGTIDGQSSTFFEVPPADGKPPSYRFKTGNWSLKDWRPSQMVFFVRCREVSVTGVSLLNAPYWTLFLLGCDDVHVRGLTIRNPPLTPNGDGIDIDCCRNVTVSDCVIFSGDDSITLRGNGSALGEDKPCENVTVSNCVLSTPCNAIRVGVGDGTVRNCVLSNVVITGARTGINMVCRYSEFRPRGTRIENIRFSDFVMDTVLPIQVIAGNGAQAPAGIRDVSFSGFRVTGNAGFYFGGNPGLPVTGLRFRDWDMTLTGGTDNQELAVGVPHPYPIPGYPGLNGGPALPCAVYGTNAADVVFDGFRVRWSNLARVWRDGFVFVQVSDLVLRGLDLRQPRDAAGAVVRGVATGDVFVSGCRAVRGTHTFLQIDNPQSGARIGAAGNDLSQARHAFLGDTRALVPGAGDMTSTQGAPRLA